MTLKAHRGVQFIVAALVAGALALLATGSAAGGIMTQWGTNSRVWWASHPESDAKVPEPAGLFQPKTDDDFARHVREARAIPVALSKPWRNAGPFGGIESVPNVGGGNGRFGKVGGIGTAIAVDPNDASGNTVYLGGHGGLYKSTDGGATVKNITDGKLLRYSIGAVAVDPHNSNNLYVGTGVAVNTVSDDAAGTGMYVSHDAGKTFSSPVKNTDGYGVNAIVVLNDGSILAGTNYGLWRSTDHGASFIQVPLPTNADHTGPAPKPLGSTVSSIAIRPGHANEVTLTVGWARGKEALSDGTIVGTGNGLYRSTNGGATWSFMDSTSQLKWAGTSTDPVGRASIAYANGDVMWALVQDAGRSAGKNAADLPSLPQGAGNIAFGTTVLNGVYRSPDNGATWSLQATAQTLIAALGATTATPYYALYAAGVQSQYNNWILADPTNADRVYLGLEEIYTGTYHGVDAAPSTTWTAVAKYSDICGFFSYPINVPGYSNGFSCPDGVPYYGGATTHPDQHAAAFAHTPNNGLRLYTGNDGGWWAQDAHSLVDGSTGFDSSSWTSLNHPATVLPWDVAMSQDGSLLLALQDNGTNRIRPDGSGYNLCGGDGVYVYPGKDANSVYCGIQGAVILGSRDDFHSTILVQPVAPAVDGAPVLLPGLPGATFTSPWVVDETNADHILAAAAVIMETTAGLDSNVMDPSNTVALSTQWKTVFTPPARADKLAWDASAAFTRGDVSYVGMCALCRPAFGFKNVANPTTVHSQIATNVGGAWHLAASKGLPHEMISGIAVDPSNPKTLYVSLRQFIVLTADQKVTGDQKIMVSHDAGEHFTDLTGNLPRVDAHRVELREGRLMLATDVGIFTAPAGSTTWSRLGTGLPEVPFRSMRFDLTGRYLIAGAYGRGAYIYDFGAAETFGKKTPATSVKGRRQQRRLPATGVDTNVALAMAMIVVAAGISRRARRAS